MTIVETATPPGAPMPLPLPNGADGPPPEPPLSNGPTTPAVIDSRPRVANATDPAVKAEGLRRLRETNDSQRKIAEDLAVSPSLVSRWRSEANIARPPGAPKAPAVRAPGTGRKAGAGREPAVRRRAMVDRLFKAFQRQVAAIETRVWAADVELVEKDARTLGVLAKTLETLIELDRDGAKVGEPEPRDRDLEELDADLAARIAKWAAGGAET